jgi:hypothetical protein
MVDRVTVAEREARALALRRDGHTYVEIGQALGVSRQMATRIVQRGMRRIVVEPATQVRAIELDLLGHLQVEALAVLRRRHFLVQGGEVVTRLDPDTGREEELLDDGPVLAAIAAVVRIAQRRAAVLGLDAPAKVDAKVDGTLTTMDAIDAHIAELEAQLGDDDPTYYEVRRREEGRARELSAFRTRWQQPDRRPLADVAGFIAEALELAFGQLDLDADELEHTATEVEHYLVVAGRG